MTRTSCARAGNVAAVGRMRDLRPLDGEVEELDGRGLCALPGLVDCHTHACFAGDRVEEFELRAIGASYEELHAAGGGILATVEATRAAGEDGLRGRCAPAPRLDAPGGHDDVRGQVRLRPRPRDRARVAAGDRGRGRCPDVAGRARRPARVRRRRRLSRLRARRGAAGSGADRRGRRRLPRARRLHRGAGAALPRRLRRRGPRACACTATSSPSPARVPLAVELGARSVDHLEATGAEGILTLADSDVVGVLLPVARSSSDGRCRRRGHSSTRARRSPSRPTSIPEALSARAFRSSAPSPARSSGSRPAEALACLHGQRGPRPPARGSNRAARAWISTRTSVLLDAPDWRYLAYHVGGPVVKAVLQAEARLASLG